MQTHHSDILILGAGAAGLTAGIYGARSGKTVRILERGAPGGQAAITARIDNYPGVPEADGFALTRNMLAQAERFGCELLTCDVQRAELAEKTIHTDRGTFTADALILATGAEPRKLGIPGEERFRGSGVSYCASCDGFFYRGKEIYVVGGGNSACEEALQLARFGSSVHLLVRRDHLRCQTAIEQELRANEKVHIHFCRELTAIEGQEHPDTLHLRDTETGQTETVTGEGLGVFIFAGYVPATALFTDQLALDDGGYILTDHRMRTSLPGVFAAGDVRQKQLRQIVTAAADGAAAAYYAADLV